MRRTTDLPQGTLDLLILRTLASGSMHGGGGDRAALQQVTGNVLQTAQRPVYRALHRLEGKVDRTRPGWASTGSAGGVRKAAPTSG